jgi:hypothetical protein
MTNLSKISIFFLLFLTILGLILVGKNSISQSVSEKIGFEKEYSSKINAFLKTLEFTESVYLEPSLNLDTEGDPAETIKINSENNFKINIKSFYFKNKNNELNSEFFKKVISHELMHVITNQNNQISNFNNKSLDISNKLIYDKLELECKSNFFNKEGCFKANSYLTIFKNKFWTNELLVEFNNLQQIENQNEYSKQLSIWGEKYKDQFVSKLAYTNIEEDISESFSLWILESKIEGINQIQKDKIQFFDKFDELKKFKNNFNSNFNLK